MKTKLLFFIALVFTSVAYAKISSNEEIIVSEEVIVVSEKVVSSVKEETIIPRSKKIKQKEDFRQEVILNTEKARGKIIDRIEGKDVSSHINEIYPPASRSKPNR